MKKLLSLVLTLAFAASTLAPAQAQTPTPGPAEKKAEKPAEMKRMPVRNANGTVKTASADSIVVAGKDRKKDAEWTFAVDPNTAIRKGGKSITPTDIKPGDAVHVRYMDVGGKAVAQSVMVRTNGKK